jgi:uncharacterized membrane protein YqjE
MSTPPGTDFNPSSGASSGQGPESVRPAGWLDALVSLLASRVALVQFESRAAARESVKWLIGIAVAGMAVIFAWALFVIGGIGVLVVVTTWPWYLLALGAGLCHVLAAGGIALILKSTQTAVFPITRAEFQKDREWLKTLKSPQN